MSRKFAIGEAVKMSPEAREANSGARSHTGVVVDYHHKHDRMIKVRRDGLIGVELWHESAWESAEPRAGSYTGGPC